MRGTVGWYRKDFKLPSAQQPLRLDAALRVGQLPLARLAQRQAASARTAAPTSRSRCASRAACLKRGGTNRLVIRVENIRKSLRPAAVGLHAHERADRRLVELRRHPARGLPQAVDRVDFNTVQVLPDLPCRTCAATMNFRVTVRNFSDRAQRVRITGRFGNQHRALPRARRSAPSASRTFRTSIRVGNPRLWSPRNPSLYDVRLDLRAGDRASSTATASRAASAR